MEKNNGPPVPRPIFVITNASIANRATIRCAGRAKAIENGLSGWSQRIAIVDARLIGASLRAINPTLARLEASRLCALNERIGALVLATLPAVRS